MIKNYSTVDEVHEAYEKKLETPSSMTQKYFDQISKSHHNAYITLCQERAIKQAKFYDEILIKNQYKVPREQYPLFAIPMAQKDNLHVEGVKTTCASKILENYIPPFTSTVVERLENAGVITLGKLNMDEFAMGSSNENSAFGVVHHPTHEGYVPGGSSGGSGASVAARLCVASTGSDTGGSIRLPASFCGVVGFKPTYGRVSRYGLVAFASSLDQVGPLAQTVEDAAHITEVISGSDPKDSTSSSKPCQKWTLEVQKEKKQKKIESLKVGVPKEYFVEGLHPEVKERLEQCIDYFKSQGAEVISVNLPHTPYAIATYYMIALCEAASNLSRFDGIKFGVRSQEAERAKTPVEYYKKVRSLFGEEVKRRIVLGTFALSSGYREDYYIKAAQVRRLIRNDFEEAFKNVEVILSPVSPTTAFKQGEKCKNPLQMYLTDIFTIPASLAGLPALSVPIGNDSQGLPIGMQVLAARFNESAVFKAGVWAEKFSKSFGVHS